MTESRRSDEAGVRLARSDGARAETSRSGALLLAQDAVGVPAAKGFSHPQRRDDAESQSDQQSCQQSPHGVIVARKEA